MQDIVNDLKDWVLQGEEIALATVITLGARLLALLVQKWE
jgi:hypothetical protein